MLGLAEFETVRTDAQIVFPAHVPLVSDLVNRYVGHLPGLAAFSLMYGISGSTRLNDVAYAIARRPPWDPIVFLAMATTAVGLYESEINHPHTILFLSRCDHP